jgi:hypothetical protein
MRWNVARRGDRTSPVEANYLQVFCTTGGFKVVRILYNSSQLPRAERRRGFGETWWGRETCVKFRERGSSLCLGDTR